MNEYLFVYGTLIRDVGHEMYRHLARGAEFISDGYFHGRLYYVNRYPGAISSLILHEKVFGELYKMRNPNKSLALLDDYEECSDRYPEPREYVRKIQHIYLSDGRKMDAWVYLYNRPVDNLKQIVSGRYLEPIK